jgi:hypothetical protein
MTGPDNDGMDSSDIGTVLFRIPKKKEFATSLDRICERLLSLGCAGATGLKQKIEQQFTEV